AISFVSLLPKSLSIHNVGTTAFHNEEKSIPIVGLESFMMGEYQKLLGPKKIRVSKLYYNQKKFNEIEATAGKGLGAFLAGDDGSGEIFDFLLAEGARSKATHLLVLKPIRHDNYRLHPAGFGVFCRQAFGISNNASTYWLYQM